MCKAQSSWLKPEDKSTKRWLHNIDNGPENISAVLVSLVSPLQRGFCLDGDEVDGSQVNLLIPFWVITLHCVGRNIDDDDYKILIRWEVTLPRLLSYLTFAQLQTNWQHVKCLMQYSLRKEANRLDRLWVWSYQRPHHPFQRYPRSMYVVLSPTDIAWCGILWHLV